MSDTNLDAILDSGNLEDIDALLTAIENGTDEQQAAAEVAESGNTGSDPAAQPTQSTEAPADKPDAVEAQGDEPSEAVVLARDGKHTIPFSELENARRRASAMEQQLADLQREKRLLEQQLTDANITPKQIPEKVRFTPEQIAELETFGEIGQAVAVLAQQNAVLMEQLSSRGTEPQRTAEEPINPLATNPDTVRWAQNDAQWAVVESVNMALDADPAWSGVSLEQRVPELVRRTKLVLDEAARASVVDINQAADAALQRASRAAPTSLTDVGGETPGSSKTPAERLADGDERDVEAYLAQKLAQGVSMDDAIASLL